MSKIVALLRWETSSLQPPVSHCESFDGKLSVVPDTYQFGWAINNIQVINWRGCELRSVACSCRCCLKLTLIAKDEITTSINGVELSFYASPPYSRAFLWNSRTKLCRSSPHRQWGEKRRRSGRDKLPNCHTRSKQVGRVIALKEEKEEALIEKPTLKSVSS